MVAGEAFGSSMDREKDAFYVFKKGSMIGVYKSLSDFKDEAGSLDPSITVCKGYGLPKDAEEYLASRGLKSPTYSIAASDVKDHIFGTLAPYKDTVGSDTVKTDTRAKRVKLDNCVEAPRSSSSCDNCIVEFDGASKGNPGLAGAGAVLRQGDGKVICRLREGVGIATNNVAEYRAVILGMKFALKKGFKRISIKGDSMLVVMQIQGKWKIKSQNLAELCKEAKELKDKFQSFQISHVLREFNSEADTLANQALNLRDGQVESDVKYIEA